MIIAIDASTVEATMPTRAPVPGHAFELLRNRSSFAAASGISAQIMVQPLRAPEPETMTAMAITLPAQVPPADAQAASVSRPRTEVSGGRLATGIKCPRHPRRIPAATKRQRRHRQRRGPALAALVQQRQLLSGALHTKPRQQVTAFGGENYRSRSRSSHNSTMVKRLPALAINRSCKAGLVTGALLRRR